MIIGESYIRRSRDGLGLDGFVVVVAVDVGQRHDLWFVPKLMFVKRMCGRLKLICKPTRFSLRRVGLKAVQGRGCRRKKEKGYI